MNNAPDRAVVGIGFFFGNRRFQIIAYNYKKIIVECAAHDIVALGNINDMLAPSKLDISSRGYKLFLRAFERYRADGEKESSLSNSARIIQ
jgi:hypothetical protein